MKRPKSTSASSRCLSRSSTTARRRARSASFRALRTSQVLRHACYADITSDEEARSNAVETYIQACGVIRFEGLQTACIAVPDVNVAVECRHAMKDTQDATHQQLSLSASFLDFSSFTRSHQIHNRDLINLDRHSRQRRLFLVTPANSSGPRGTESASLSLCGRGSRSKMACIMRWVVMPGTGSRYLTVRRFLGG